MVGTHLGGFEIVRPLAQGGMADVFLGQRASGTQVALKVMTKRDEEACQLFLDEARVASLLDHPNIAAVHEVAVDAGAMYLAMEYVRGADLREVLSACARLHTLPSYAASLAIVAQAAAGLDHAHRRCAPDGTPLHLVHRDVSLSNIMVGHDGVAKVVDFGIARSALSSVHTQPGIVRGKASYMSPEQCLGEAVDHRTDVFALGIVLYELTTGARCFGGKTDFERMLAVVRGDYLPPSDLVAEYPPDLEAVVRTALAADPAERFASCSALRAALDGVMVRHGWTEGRVAIQQLMRDLFVAPAAPIVDDEGSRTVENAPVVSLLALAPTAKITRPPRFARGTLCDHCADEDMVTRGRPSVRRISSRRLAA